MVAIRIFSIIAAVVAAVIATPTAGHSAPMTVEQASQQCGNGNVVSCCNTADKDLLGLNCAQIPVALALIPISETCSKSNIAACCQTDQDGVINADIACTTLPLL